MRTFIFVFLLVLIGSPVYGFVIYNTDVKDNDAYTTITLGLSSSSPVNYWDLTFLLPDNSEIVSIKDTLGPITQYSEVGKNVYIKTNSGPRRTTEVITMEVNTADVVDDAYSPLKIVKLSYSGFENENTVVNIKTNERIIVSNVPFRFSIIKENNSLSLSGKGPVNVIFSMSDSGMELENYVHIGNGDITKADELNQIVPRVIGIIPYYSKFPVVILPDSQYTRELDGFSAGTYRTGGYIVMPESKSSGKETAGIVLHETVHAYNDQILRWSNTNVGWFDEGTATYVSWAANQINGIRQPEIFGDPVVYYEGFVKYTIPSQGDREDLWEYYQQDKDFMKTWKSHDSSQDDETRRFGYAFSQLMIMDYVNRNGPLALHDIYANLSQVDHVVESADEYNRIVLDVMGSDMKPCYSESREEFDRCLDGINDMKASIPETQLATENYGNVLDTEQLLNETYEIIEKEKNEISISKIVFMIADFVERIISWISSIPSR